MCIIRGVIYAGCGHTIHHERILKCEFQLLVEARKTIILFDANQALPNDLIKLDQDEVIRHFKKMCERDARDNTATSTGRVPHCCPNCRPARAQGPSYNHAHQNRGEAPMPRPDYPGALGPNMMPPGRYPTPPSAAPTLAHPQRALSNQNPQPMPSPRPSPRPSAVPELNHCDDTRNLDAEPVPKPSPDSIPEYENYYNRVIVSMATELASDPGLNSIPEIENYYDRIVASMDTQLASGPRPDNIPEFEDYYNRIAESQCIAMNMSVQSATRTEEPSKTRSATADKGTQTEEIPNQDQEKMSEASAAVTTPAEVAPATPAQAEALPKKFCQSDEDCHC